MQVIDAICAGDCIILGELLDKENGFALNEPLENGATPLVTAIESGQVSVVKMFLEKGAKADQLCHKKVCINAWRDPPEYNYERCYPLHCAVEKSDPDIVLMLMSHGAHISQTDIGIRGLLYRAIRWNNEPLVRFIVNQMRDEDMFSVQSRFDLSEHLQTAVLDRNVKMVNILIEMGGNVNQPHQDMLPIVLAANGCDMRMCLTLVNNGAHINMADEGTSLGHRNTPLGMAIAAPNMHQAVKRLILLGADVNGAIDWTLGSRHRSLLPGSTMLHLAVYYNKRDVANMLLLSGARLAGTDSLGNTALHVASSDPTCQRDSLQTLKFLLEYNKNGERKEGGEMDVNGKNADGNTALMLAVQERNLEAVEALLVYGADLNVRNAKKQNALFFAIQSGSDAIVHLLLEAGCDLSISVMGLSPIHQCVAIGDLTLTEMMMMKELSLFDTDSKRRQTCLHLAVQSKSDEMVEFCLEKGLNVNAVDRNGDTPLLLASRADNPRLCEILLENGAFMDKRDRNQKETALSLSVYFGLEKNSELLIKHGANVDIPDKRDTTPLYWSIFNSRIQTLQWLIHADATFNRRILNSFPRNLSVMRNTGLYNWLVSEASSVRSLQRWCRTVLRRHLMRCVAQGCSIHPAITRLPLPTRLKEFLRLELDVVQPFHEESPSSDQEG